MRRCLPSSSRVPFDSQAGKAKDRLYASEEPVQVRLIKLATSEVINRPPRHLPRTVHAAYVVKRAGMMGNVERRFQG